MHRRRYLGLAGGAATLAVAGCQGDGSTDDGGGNSTDDDSDDNTRDGTGNGEETGDGNGESEFPTWANWVPASTVTEDRALTAVNTDTLRENLPPDVYSSFQASTLPESFGFEPAAMDYIASVRSSSGIVLEVVTGSFDVDSVLSAIDATGETGEQYNGFETIPSRNLAVGSSAIIIGDRRLSIDANAGEEPRLGREDQNWGTLLRESQTNAVLSAEAPPLLLAPEAPFEVELVGSGFDPTGGQQVQARGYYVFESTAAATDVQDNRRGELQEHFIGATEGSVTGVERIDTMLVVSAETTTDAL